jgi:uncharacterized membrane protein YqiK
MLTFMLIAIGIFVLLGGPMLSFMFFPEHALRRRAGIGGSVAIFMVLFWASSYRYIPDGKAGIVVRNAFGSPLSDGRVIAVNGEMGTQAKVLSPGIHGGYWPFLFEVDEVGILTIEEGHLGVITANDGLPMPTGTSFAPEWNSDEKMRMLDATHFLTDGKGVKGPQSTVLGPGKYYLNTKLFTVSIQPATTIGVGEVGVIKSNIGNAVTDTSNTLAKEHKNTLVDSGQRGIWREPLGPQLVYMNPSAFEVTTVSTVVQVVEYTAEAEKSQSSNTAHGERPIEVKTSDGFTFPVDVRVEYYIEPRNAPLVVSLFGDDSTGGLLRAKLNSTVRDIFRNTAEKVKALDYVNRRSEQGDLATGLLRSEMADFGLTVVAVRIGDIDNTGESLSELLKTQTDRELALQQQQTFTIRQAAAQKEQEFNKAQQAALEEKRLATALYDVKVNEQSNAKQIAQAKADAEKQTIAAKAEAEMKLAIARAEAESIRMRTEAEAAGVLANQQAVAKGYQQKAAAIGGDNLAMIESMEMISRGQVRITPEIVVGSSNGGSSILDALGAIFARNIQKTGRLLPPVPPAPSDPTAMIDR